MKSLLLCTAFFSLVCVGVMVARPAAISSAYDESQSSVATVVDSGGSARNQGLNHGVVRYTIAFKSFAPNNSDIFLADEDGRHVRPLVPDPALDYNASFSADGRWVVFTSHRGGSAAIGECIRMARACRD